MTYVPRQKNVAPESGSGFTQRKLCRKLGFHSSGTTVSLRHGDRGGSAQPRPRGDAPFSVEGNSRTMAALRRTHTRTHTRTRTRSLPRNSPGSPILGFQAPARPRHGCCCAGTARDACELRHHPCLPVPLVPHSLALRRGVILPEALHCVVHIWSCGGI